MAYVVINVLTVPDGDGATLEKRFAGRAGAVDKAPGFERFELLRPDSGTGRYLVYTRWRSREDYEAWLASDAFTGGHRRGAESSDKPARPAATGSEIWAFEVSTSSQAPAADDGSEATA